MLKELSRNYKKCILYTRYYSIVAIILFLLFGDGEDINLLQRGIIVVVVLIAYLIFFNFPGFYMKRIISIHRKNQKAMKMVNLQMNFFIIFFSLSIFMVVAAAIANPSSIAMLLLGSVVPLGIITGVLKSKSKYIYEDDANEEINIK